MEINTQQAILIGTAESLLDLRRMKNLLKGTYNYYCVLLEEPTIDLITEALI